MNQLTFELDPKNKIYFVLDTNDEKLFVIAQLLLDVHILDACLKFMHSREDKSYVDRFHFHKKNHKFMIIEMFNDHQNLQENDNILAIEIENTNIDYLTKQWFELSKQNPQYITITRVQDVYTMK